MSSPQATARTAYDAISRKDLKSFTKTLADAALAQYGNEAGLEKLATELDGHDPYTYVPDLKSAKQNSCGYDISRTYLQGVYDGHTAGLILDLTVHCDVTYELSDSCYSGVGNGGYLPPASGIPGSPPTYPDDPGCGMPIPLPNPNGSYGACSRRAASRHLRIAGFRISKSAVI